jgi:hypothetical protein
MKERIDLLRSALKHISENSQDFMIAIYANNALFADDLIASGTVRADAFDPEGTNKNNCPLRLVASQKQSLEVIDK